MICCRCNRDKSIEEFYDWDRYKCKECRRELDKLRYPKRKKYFIEYQKKWKADNWERYSKLSQKANKKWYRKNREQIRQWKKFAHAIEYGKIIRPEHCQHCGKECRPEGHHEDYNKPFDVIWLCRTCHKNA